MIQSAGLPPGFDPAKPSAARIYDYLLGGKDNYEVDRAAADNVLAVAPDQRRLARANRAFAIRAVPGRAPSFAPRGAPAPRPPGARKRGGGGPTRRPAWSTSTMTRSCRST